MPRGKESSSRGKRKRRVFLCRRTVGVKVGDKVIPASFLKVEEAILRKQATDFKEAVCCHSAVVQGEA